MMIGNKTANRLFWGIVILLTMPLSTAFGQELSSFELAGAYNTTLSEKPSGWYQLADHIIFIADLERQDKTLTKRNMQAKAMIATGKQLKRWLSSECGQLDCDLSEWPERTKRILQKALVRKIQQPSLSELSGHVLENYPKGQRYRYACAIPQSKLEHFCKNIKNASINPRSIYVQTLESAIANENHPLAAALLWDAGLVHLSSISAQKAMSEQFYLNNITLKPNPLAQRKALLQLKAGKLAHVPQTLKQLPGAYSILTNMAATFATTQPENAFALWGLALAASDTEHELTLSNMRQLLEKNSMLQPIEVVTKSEIVSLSLASLGNLRFDKTIYSEEPAALRQAKSLFAKQGSKEDILFLLMDASDQAPANPQVWDYLGAILKAQKKWKQAAIVYLQLLQLRPFDSEAMAHLAQCYNKIGMSSQSELIADILFFSGKSQKSTLLTRIVQNIRRKKYEK